MKAHRTVVWLILLVLAANACHTSPTVAIPATATPEATAEEGKNVVDPRRTRIVEPLYTTDDVVVIDYDVLDYGAEPDGSTDASEANTSGVTGSYNELHL